MSFNSIVEICEEKERTDENDAEKFGEEKEFAEKTGSDKNMPTEEKTLLSAEEERGEAAELETDRGTEEAILDVEEKAPEDNEEKAGMEERKPDDAELEEEEEQREDDEEELGEREEDDEEGEQPEEDDNEEKPEELWHWLGAHGSL